MPRRESPVENPSTWRTPTVPTPEALSQSLSVPEAVARLVEEPRFRRLVSSFCGARAEEVLHSAAHARTEEDFQASLGKRLLQAILQRTSNGFLHQVDPELSTRPPSVYISNHRDIVLDTSLLNDVLISHGKPVPHVAIGDNLLETPWTVAFFRLCRAFVIERGLSGRRLYEQAQRVSEFVHLALERKEPVWIAQRAGRTKDGVDRTDPGLLRMLLLSAHKSSDPSGQLHLTPVAVSYEYEPCDSFKAAQLIDAGVRNEPALRSRRDALHMLRGLVQKKGRIRLVIRPPLGLALHLSPPNKPPSAELVAALAEDVDREIGLHTTIWPTNYAAHDLLHRSTRYAEHYTRAEREEFEAHLSASTPEILASPADARSAMLALYARAVERRSPPTAFG